MHKKKLSPTIDPLKIILDAFKSKSGNYRPGFISIKVFASRHVTQAAFLGFCRYFTSRQPLWQK
ncbi:MAG: hypothetical protein WCX71_00840, partial [Candidatus Buchananbacteria bacterium]